MELRDYEVNNEVDEDKDAAFKSKHERSSEFKQENERLSESTGDLCH